MGGSQSTRKISIDNDNSIQVSQEALDRIQSQLAAKRGEQLLEPQQPVYSSTPIYYPPPDSSASQAEEDYWKGRINDLKKQHDKISEAMNEEYQKTLKEADQLFESVKINKEVNKLPPCQEEKAKVLQCYDTNPETSLLCSVLVNSFNECVCQSRVAAITSTS